MVDKKKSGDHLVVGIISGSDLGIILGLGDHFGAGIISGAVQHPLF